MPYKSGLEQDERGLTEQELAELLERKAKSKAGRLSTRAATRRYTHLKTIKRGKQFNGGR